MNNKSEQQIPEQETPDKMVAEKKGPSLAKQLTLISIIGVLLLLIWFKSCGTENNNNNPINIVPTPISNQTTCESNGYTATKTAGSLVQLDQDSFLKLYNAKRELGDQALSEIQDLHCLELLIIFNDGQKELVDITPLSKLTNLKRLALDGWDIIDLTPLRNLHSLRELGIAHSNITDISELSNLQQLTTLSLFNNSNITDIEPLSKLKNLQILDLSGTNVEKLTPLLEIATLKKLILANTAWADAGLKGLNIEGLTETSPNLRYVAILKLLTFINPSLEIDLVMLEITK